MIIYITRHGQPQKRAPHEGPANHHPDHPPGDPPLSELGRLQARKLGERLREQGFTGTIYASPYRRTAETGDVIAETLDSTFHPEPAIREYTGPSLVDFNGLDLERFKALYPRVAPGTELPHPWWTTEQELTDEDGYRPAVEARVGALLETVMAPDNPDVLLIGHGASAGSAVRYLYQRRTHGEFSQRGRTWNCVLTAFRLDEAGLTPLYHGDTSHLDLAAGEVTSNSERIESLVVE